ncbi:MAG: 50S ribosomal protein L11 methyltransferase [Pseudomonadota bacterium]
MTAQKLIWQGPREMLQTLDILLTEVLFPPADAVTLLKDDAAKTEEAAEWSLHAYFDPLPPSDALAALLQEAGLSLSEPVLETLPDKDWVAHSLEGLGVVTAGRFVLYGSHDAGKVGEMPGLKIQVEANRAFGTGHHPTTAGCLEALSRCADRSPARILDVGTGSGVLAMAARRVWPDIPILATDIDAPSIDICRENAALNQIDDIDFRVADGIDASVKAAAPYDLIFANILADPLVALSADIAESLSPGGTLILAGLLARQEPQVVKAYEAQGVEVTDRVESETWPVLVLRF